MRNLRSRKRLKLFLIAILSLVSVLFAWFHLPIEIKRRSEINKGNAITQNLNDYRLAVGKYPEKGDWKTLNKLGFSMNDLGTQPDYKKLSDTSFELIFLEGFDGPYLTYKSTTKKWSIE